MTPEHIWDSMEFDGYVRYNREWLIEAARREAGFSQNNYFARALLYGMAQMLEEWGWAIEEGAELGEPVGMDPDVEAAWRNAHQDDGIDIDPKTKKVV